MTNTNKSVNASWADSLGASFGESRANRVARNAVTSMNVMAAGRDVSRMRTYHDTYSVELPKPGDVTNQRQSGRCWMFSAFNVARAATIKLLDVDTFEFSQAFGMFYDKLEKANATLENVIRMAGRPLDDRELCSVLADGMSDGGYYVFAMNLIAKWGLMPKDAMPETACSKNSGEMDAQLERLVRKGAHELREAFAAGEGEEALRERKQAVLADVYAVLAVCLGEPPAAFDLEVKVGPKCKVDEAKLSPVLPEEPRDEDAESDKGKKDEPGRRILRDPHITPREFAERYVPFDPEDFVELVYMPATGYEANTCYRVLTIDSVEGARPNRFLNTSQDVLEAAAVASLKAGVPVCMACDVMQEFPRHVEDFPGVLATDGVDLEGLFGVGLKMDRRAMLDVRETSLTHAMTFQGVELDAEGGPVAWKVENSWGKDSCKDGYLYMSAEWFRTYGGEVVVRREFVPPELLAVWDDDARVVDVEPWSCLACGLGRPC